jgi:hypothetical protein
MKPNNKGHRYFCKLCGKHLTRDSEKKWIKSFCETAAKQTRIYRAT